MNDANIHLYDDIINLSRPVSARHTPMPRENRAAQFAPFAALTGYDAEIRETARLTNERRELDETQKAEIDYRLQILEERGRGSDISVTFFKNDERKNGGSYIEVSGSFMRIDRYAKALVLMTGEKIPIEDIYTLQIQ